MEFDYVIVGGGSGGATLASRLSEDPGVQVCLVEAGGEGRGILVRAPAATVAMLPGRPRINNYAYRTVPQPGLDGRRGYQPRGRCLGGSSAINIARAVRMAQDMGPGKTIVTILCDYGNRYASKIYNPEFLHAKGLPVPNWMEGRTPLDISSVIEPDIA